jgi:PIN domain nuclease of toxin-antitoxin system
MILMDTHVWLWWTSLPERLSPSVRATIDNAALDAQLAVSTVSVWEIATKAALGKLPPDILPPEINAREWVERASQTPGLRILPLAPDVALMSAELPEPFHRDPADRLIVAQARRSRATLVTADRKILDYPHVKTLWE